MREGFTVHFLIHKVNPLLIPNFVNFLLRQLSYLFPIPDMYDGGIPVTTQLVVCFHPLGQNLDMLNEIGEPSW